ncbi:phosphotransferase [Streptomyces sp. NPDC020379]|uniref:phosphotransferase n=1 Tax=Streptomyces sp. NPDC020379 TaxID=3365071 RepID=UPI0037AEC1BF
MYSPPPDPDTAHRMRAHHDRAARALGVRLDDGTEFWGWAGRTLGRGGTATDGRRVWLRLLTAPEAKATGKLWEGNRTAEKAFGALGGRRPELLAVQDAREAGVVYRAELSAHLDMPVISSDPVLRSPASLSPGWWGSLHTALRTVTDATTDRIAVRREYLERALPQFVEVPAPETIDWVVVHGDLHWANLTGPSLRILDWEGWGLGPRGYDESTLLAYSLLQPDIANRVRECFPQLGSPATWAGEATIVAELLQTVSRGDNQELAGPLRMWAERLRSRARVCSTPHQTC